MRAREEIIVDVKPWHIAVLVVIVVLGIFISRLIKGLKEGRNGRD